MSHDSFRGFSQVSRRSRPLALSVIIRSLAGVVGLTLLALLAAVATATDGTWTGGTAGTWDTTATNWSGVSGTPWDIINGPANKALFGTPANSAVLSGAVYAGSMQIDQSTTISNNADATNNFLQYASNSTMAFNVAAGKVGTITADIKNAGDSNYLTLTGGGTLALGGQTTLVINDGGAKSAYFSVNGGSTLNVTGTISTMIDNSSNRGSAGNPYLGSVSSNNTVNVTGSGKMLTGNFNIGSAGNNNNSVYVSSPGVYYNAATSLASQSWVLYGTDAQLNMNSSNNLVEVSNGAVVQQISGGGSAGWTVGTAAGSDGNQLILKGLGSMIVKSGNGGYNTAGGVGSSNAIIVKEGGFFLSGRVGVGLGNGVASTNNNYFLVTGTSDGTSTGTPSYYRLNGGTNGHFQVGGSNNASNNAFRVENGARVDLFVSGTGKDAAIGKTTGSNNNSILVTGVGSTLNFLFDQELTVGGNASVAGGTGNSINIQDGGSLIMDNRSNLIALPAAVPNITWAAVPLNGGALVLAGDTSAINLGNGGSNTALLRIGSGNSHTGIELANATSTLTFNNGRLTAGLTGNLVTGLGTVVLNGVGYVSNASGFTNSITRPITGTGRLVKRRRWHTHYCLRLHG